MALKDLPVYVDHQDALTRLRLAADLAARHGSHLTALFVPELTELQRERRKAAEFGLVSAKDMRELDGLTRASISAVEERLRTALRETTKRATQADLLCVEGEAGVLVPQYARYADLCIVGRDERLSRRQSATRFPSNCCLSPADLFLSFRPAHRSGRWAATSSSLGTQVDPLRVR